MEVQATIGLKPKVSFECNKNKKNYYQLGMLIDF